MVPLTEIRVLHRQLFVENSNISQIQDWTRVMHLVPCLSCIYWSSFYSRSPSFCAGHDFYIISRILAFANLTAAVWFSVFRVVGCLVVCTMGNIFSVALLFSYYCKCFVLCFVGLSCIAYVPRGVFILRRCDCKSHVLRLESNIALRCYC